MFLRKIMTTCGQPCFFVLGALHRASRLGLYFYQSAVWVLQAWCPEVTHLNNDMGGAGLAVREGQA